MCSSDLSFSVNEGAGSVHVTVTRSGDTTSAATLEFATADGTANDRGDYTTAIGRLRFGPGDTAQAFDIFITDDGYAEGNETVQLTLSNPSAGALAGGTATALLTIVDNDLAPSAANPIDGTAFFVRQHYVDFLNREPDASGLAFWTGEIESCGADAQCREVKRINVSAAFFLSIEYQETGFLVERLYRAAFNRLPAYREFHRDTRQLGRGVVVGQGAWEAQLESNKQAFASEFVAHTDFLAVYAGLTNEQYVDALNVNTGNSLSSSERQALVKGLNTATLTRATVLRQVAEDADFAARELNRAFVLAQYLGYLRRDPDAAGLAFWLAKLELFGGDFRRAEMVKAFISSDEYRLRFGQ